MWLVLIGAGLVAIGRGGLAAAPEASDEVVVKVTAHPRREAEEPIA